MRRCSSTSSECRTVSCAPRSRVALKRHNARSTKIGTMKTVVGVRYCLRTLNARVVNIVCDKQRRQKQSAEPLTAQKSHKKPPRATPSHSMPLLSHFSKTKASHYPWIVIGQGVDTIHLHLSLALSLSLFSISSLFSPFSPSSPSPPLLAHAISLEPFSVKSFALRFAKLSFSCELLYCVLVVFSLCVIGHELWCCG